MWGLELGRKALVGIYSPSLRAIAGPCITVARPLGLRSSRAVGRVEGEGHHSLGAPVGHHTRPSSREHRGVCPACLERQILTLGITPLSIFSTLQFITEHRFITPRIFAIFLSFDYRRPDFTLSAIFKPFRTNGKPVDHKETRARVGRRTGSCKEEVRVTGFTRCIRATSYQLDAVCSVSHVSSGVAASHRLVNNW